MNKTIIGLDCGASHSTIKIWSDGKVAVENHDLPGINPDLINSKEMADRLMLEFEKLKPYDDPSFVIGMAGLDNEAEIYMADKVLRNILDHSVSYSGLSVVSDIELVLWAGSETGTGIGLIAGTGSNCLGRNSVGIKKKTGGMSHLLSDEGGGFSLGSHCLHLITKMSDGREEKTELLDEVLREYNCQNTVDLKNNLLNSTEQKVQIARAAPILLKASTRGERAAGKIVAEESLELVRMVATVNDFFRNESLPLFLAGSLFKDRDYRDLLITGLSRFFPRQKAIIVSPIEGAYNYAKINIK